MAEEQNDTQSDDQQSPDDQQQQPEQQTGKRHPWEDSETAEKEIRRLRDENAKRRTWERDNAPKLGEYEKMLEAQKSEEDRRNEALQKANDRAQALAKRAARAEVMAMASEGFADPSDAADTLDVTSFLNDDGDFDADAAGEALKGLLERKPHWAKQGEQQRRGPRPDPSQGSSGNGNTPGIEEQISQAQKDGDWKLVLRLQTQKMMPEIRQYASGQHR